MKVTKKELEEKYINILTTERVEDITRRQNNGETIHRNEKNLV